MRTTPVLVAALAAASLVPHTGSAGGDPPYSVPEQTMLRALSCSAEFTHLDEREPVLLVHGTAGTPEEAWSWNYAENLPAAGFDVCMVRLPNRALSDQQDSAEYVVYAIKWMRARSGSREIDVTGHSQGGLLPRWALRWWPSLHAMVDDFVAMAAPSHGASGADALCPTSCAPAVQQMKSGSNYLAALNSGDETPGPIDYTSIYSMTDELVQPFTSPPLAGGTNVMLQDVCPGRPVHHFAQVYDAVTYALAIDAFTNPGPADVARLPADVCTRTWMPGATDADVLSGNAMGYGNAYLAFGAYPGSESEPDLKPYAQD
ncbi:MAG: esterase/lipase family protein [Actinomycetota bacterium]